MSTLERARLCVLLGMGLADAAIVSWDSKYAFNHWCPIAGICAASTDRNPGTDKDASWLYLITTRPFPAFTSGHSTFSATAARIIARVLGSDNIAFETTSQGLLNITHSFVSFSVAAAEASQSRIYGGIRRMADCPLHSCKIVWDSSVFPQDLKPRLVYRVAGHDARGLVIMQDMARIG